ncbi:unnamed protein product [Vicia faba]|uniref:HAT C-terminal dimerisation domain-containing protein n=1 Tax=Vicia faba TaxID=3906 RepID=A0AAV0ZP71_VICFA|nr:unnamed protein product [Vicia faba]
MSIVSSCSSIHDFFEYISLIVTTTNASCKRRDALAEAQHQDILNKLESGEISGGKGLHQSSSLTRLEDTIWSSHHTTLLRLDQMWSFVLKVLSMVDEDGRGPSQAAGIPVPNMDDEIPIQGRSRVEERTITNLHHYRAEIFYVAIDKICVEMDHRFSEGSNIILDCFSCLDPKNSFSKFGVDKLVRLADIYHADFSDDDRGTIRNQLIYVLQVRRNASFSTCEDVQTLILPVSTASVERVFSAMKIIKSELRNKINDVWFNDLMVCYTEREIFKSLDDIDIIRTFTAKKSRKGHLPRNFI